MMFSFALFLNVYALLIYLCLLLWYIGTSPFNYWKKQKIKFKKPVPFVGNFAPFILFQKAYHEVMHDLYTYFRDDPFGGFYQIKEPVLLVKDPDLVHRILVTDFKIFSDRGFDLFTPHKEVNPLSVNLFLANGDHWRSLRKRLTSVFTPSKLRPMQNLVAGCISKLNSVVEENIMNDSTDQDLKVLYDRLTVDVIGSCAFGIECNSLEKNSQFREMGQKSLRPSLAMSIKLFISVISKKLLIRIRWPDFPEDVTTFFRTVVLDTILYRRQNRVTRPDLLQLLMDLQNSYIEPKYAPSQVEDNLPEEDKFDEINIVGNVFLFFLAGYETTASTISFCLYELAINQDVQDRLRTEVEAAYSAHNNTLTPDVLKELKYLDAAISETLRKYPITGWLVRESSADYPIPNSDKVIKTGVKVLIPTWSIQHDWKNFPNPERYDPERFYGSNAENIRSGTYCPFGDGPRSCIGAQFARMELRTAIADAVLKYDLAPCSKTEIPLTYQSGCMLMVPKNGVWVNMKKRKINSNV